MLNGRQKVAIGGAGVLAVGGWIAYAAMHKGASAAKTFKEIIQKLSDSVHAKEIDPSKGNSMLATAELVALYKQYPPYPDAYYGVHYPVTRFRIADAAWRAWYGKTEWSLFGFDTRKHIVEMLQVVSDEIADRLGVVSPNWALGLSNVATAAGMTFENIFGNAARNTPKMDFFTSLEAQQFWTSIMLIAMEADSNKLNAGWAGAVTLLRGLATEFALIPDELALAVQWVSEWAVGGASKVVAAGVSGVASGLFATSLLPIVVTLGAVGVGLYTYSSSGGASVNGHRRLRR